MRSVHDNELFAYSADCVSKRIKLHTKYSAQQPPEYTDVVFEGVLDHMFRDVLLPSIIFDVEEADTVFVLQQFFSVMADGYRRGGWPSFFATEIDTMAQNIKSASCRMFTIASSYGIDGWIVAQSMRIEPKDGG